MNNLKVFVMMAGLTALFVALGGVFGGQMGMVLALLVAGALNFFMYFGSAKMVLRMYRARVVTEAEAPALFAMVDRLRQRAGLPMPTVAIAPHEQPNAFATGRNYDNAVVCVTAGLMRMVNREELEGVIAHELAHIKNRDMLLQTMTATLAGAISNIANFGLLFGMAGEDGPPPAVAILMAVVAPIAAMIIQFAISRQREFEADALGAEICGEPLALAGALRKLEMAAQQVPMQVAPAAAPLAQVNPLSALNGGGLGRLFSTHPPTGERIERLEAMRPGRVPVAA
jgi:heat shock protein HtpX